MVFNYTSFKVLLISHVPRLILESKCSTEWSSQTSQKQTFSGERNQVIGLLLGSRTVLQAVSIFPSTRNISFLSGKPHHHRRNGNVSPPFCPVCPHKCSLLFGISQLPTEEKWELWTPSVRQTQTSSLSLLAWDDKASLLQHEREILLNSLRK